MKEEFISPFVEMILSIGSYIHLVFSIPSRTIPIISPNLILIIVSVLFGWFWGKKAILGFKTITGFIMTVLFYSALKYIGV